MISMKRYTIKSILAIILLGAVATSDAFPWPNKNHLAKGWQITKNTSCFLFSALYGPVIYKFMLNEMNSEAVQLEAKEIIQKIIQFPFSGIQNLYKYNAKNDHKVGIAILSLIGWLYCTKHTTDMLYTFQKNYYNAKKNN